MSETDHQIFDRPKRKRRLDPEAPGTVVIAYVLWCLFGVLGAHNFYLRRRAYGAAQLGIFVLSLVLLLAVGWSVIGGLGLMLLTGSLFWDLVMIPRVLQRIREAGTR